MRPYEYYDNVHFAIAYEFDLNMYRIDRSAYNGLDWLGDLGGLKEALIIILGFIYGIFKYHTFDDYMVSALYRQESKIERMSKKAPQVSIDEKAEADMYYQKHEGSQLKTGKVNCLIQRIHDCGCSRFKKSTQERLFEKGRDLLENETDIANFLQ